MPYRAIPPFFNGDFGRENLAIEYQDGHGELELFYPDFIIKQDNKVGIFDTKSGQIAESAKSKAEALQKYFKAYKGEYELWGGIVINSAGQWKLNAQEVYQYNPKDLKGWEDLTFNQ